MNDRKQARPHERCPARNRSGDPCGHPAGWGTDHAGAGLCRNHGGCTPNGRRNAQTIIARRAVATYGLPREVDPAVALLEEVARTAGHVEWLGARIREMNPDAPVSGTIGAAWLDLYRAERRHLVRVCRDAIAAGAEARRVRIAEETGAAIVAVLHAVLADLGLADNEDVPALVARHLRAISAPDDPA